MGGGLVQVGILLVATVIGLPCFFFTLLALLDHFEQGLTNAPRAVVRRVQVVQLSAATESDAATELTGASVVELPHAVQAHDAQASEPFTVNPARAATG
ncbi:MAG TPA: hypothetical protein VGD55_07370 [Acidothermaceae bacterium]